MKKFVSVATAGVLMAAAAFAGAAEPGDRSMAHSAVDLRFGVTPFLGALSVEYQTGHYGIGIGLPGHLGVSYYQDPGRDSFFYSAGVGIHSNDGFDDYENGYYFTRRETKQLTVGGGYRWLWSSGWNITTSAGVQYLQNRYRNDNTLWGPAMMKKESVNLALGVALGYAF